MKIVLYLVLILALLVVAAGQFGWLSGRQPAGLGATEGRLKAPSPTRNSVSSQAALHPDHPQMAYASIDALPFKHGDSAASMRALGTVLAAMPGVRVVEQRPDYLYAQAQTRWLKFVDDLEFWADPGAAVLQLRSASRLGREDFGVNRQRIEAIRSAYLAQP
jgi:uncharacterized protein (DUF1499 family)